MKNKQTWAQRNFPTFIRIWGKMSNAANAKHRRDFRNIVTAKHNSDWIVSGISQDADVWQNIFQLRARTRDLFKLDPYVRKFAQELRSNVFGENGISLQMKITEDAPRTVYAADEKGFSAELLRKLVQRDRILERMGRPAAGWARAKATVQAGDPDFFANDLIERKWKRWQRKEFCTVTKRLTYQQVREIRINSAARDGDFFIRKIADPSINEFGFSLQLINSEWIDHDLNGTTASGNEIRMGVELNSFGAPVNYYVIKREPSDWQWARVGMWPSGGAAANHIKIPAEEMIFYGIVEDADQIRGVPWIVSAIIKLRHLDKYEEAEVISARVEACKGGHYVPQTGNLDALDLADKIDTNDPQLQEIVEPGQWKPLPFGWQAQAHNPTHPNGNFELFRKAILRGVCSGLPGGSYNIIASDLEGVNYSSMKGGEISTHEAWKMLQRFDIDAAELPIFEDWLSMALITQAVPLPYSKFEKLNKPCFRGRRWQGLEPVKDATANKQALENRTTSRTRITEDAGANFEEIAMELAAEKLIMEDLGIAPVEEKPAVGQGADAGDEESESEEKPKKTFDPSRLHGVNGH